MTKPRQNNKAYVKSYDIYLVSKTISIHRFSNRFSITNQLESHNQCNLLGANYFISPIFILKVNSCYAIFFALKQYFFTALYLQNRAIIKLNSQTIQV